MSAIKGTHFYGFRERDDEDITLADKARVQEVLVGPRVHQGLESLRGARFLTEGFVGGGLGLAQQGDSPPLTAVSQV